MMLPMVRQREEIAFMTPQTAPLSFLSNGRCRTRHSALTVVMVYVTAGTLRRSISHMTMRLHGRALGFIGLAIQWQRRMMRLVTAQTTINGDMSVGYGTARASYARMRNTTAR